MNIIDEIYLNFKGTVREKIIKKLQSEFNPEFLDVINESASHSVPKGSETHFKVVVVSSVFDNLTTLQVCCNVCR